MRIYLLASLALLATLPAARADDAADCDAGIAMIRMEQAKEHGRATTESLKTALRVAEREKGEKEYDECLDAVADARKALKK
ncbi:histidine kinase [Hansschlegelia quercus]|uniref:Histidine kinase n=1 Tax=Hansschlegelia quercus TaxID=2528245 RepID=A0A4V2JEA9_9HYPH|nr:histidine kinase [Hansschlegelia quercus]TBN54496.1 histidine kinase [Hansschlegelia quercus]